MELTIGMGDPEPPGDVPLGDAGQEPANKQLLVDLGLASPTRTARGCRAGSKFLDGCLCNFRDPASDLLA